MDLNLRYSLLTSGSVLGAMMRMFTKGGVSSFDSLKGKCYAKVTIIIRLIIIILRKRILPLAKDLPVLRRTLRDVFPVINSSNRSRCEPSLGGNAMRADPSSSFMTGILVENPVHQLPIVLSPVSEVRSLSFTTLWRYIYVRWCASAPGRAAEGQQGGTRRSDGCARSMMNMRGGGEPVSEETPILDHTSGLVICYGQEAEKRNDHRFIDHQHVIGSGDVFRKAMGEGPK